MTKTYVENQQGLAALGHHPKRQPTPEDFGVEMRGAVGGHFPHLPPTPKPAGSRVPDRTPEKAVTPRMVGQPKGRKWSGPSGKSRDVGEDVGEDAAE